MMSEKSQVPEGYKKTELGVIPEEWEIKKFGFVIDKQQLGVNLKASTQNEGLILIKMGNLNVGSFNFGKIEKIEETDLEKYKDYRLSYGDFLFNTRNTPQLVGKSATWKFDHMVAIFNSNIMRISFTPIYDSFWANYYFSSTQGWKSLKSISKGTTSVGAIYSKDLIRLKVPVPPISEQQKIASILSKVDEQIEQTEQIIEKTETLKKGLMQKLLIKGLGHTKFKKTELRSIPEEWDVVTIGDVITLQRGHDLPVTERMEGDFPVVGSNGLVGYHNKYKAKGPGVSMGRSGTIGKIYYCDSNYWPLNTSLYIKDFKNNNPKFIYYLLQSLDYERFNSGTSVPTLNRNLVHPYKIIFPKQYEEQQKIASILSKVDSQIQDNQNYLTRLQELKKGLMQDLLTGKVRVRN